MAKKQSVSANDILKQMYPDLATSDDYVDPNKKPDPADPATQIAALQAQIAQLTASRQEPQPVVRNRDLATLPQAPVRPVMDFATAPDPIQKPAEYAQWVSTSTQAQIQYEKEAWQWQNSVMAQQNNRANALWEDFSSSHTAYAQDEERIAIAAERVVTKNKAAGVNIDKYMYEDSGRFMNDVTAEYDKLFGKPQAEDGNNDDDDGDDDDRSVIQGSGAAAPRNGSVDVARPPEKYGALGTAVNEWQQKTGFYR